MAGWVYDAAKRQYISPGGKPLSHASTVQLRNAFAKARGEIAKDIAKRFLSGELTPASFRVEFERFIGDTITGAFLFGRGGINAALVEDATKIMAEINRQLGFADTFLTEIADGSVSDAEITNRIASYADASVKAFEEGVASSHGLILPGYPGDWETQCKCVIDPNARVLTERGWVPISRVRAGDRVLTHRGRFRKVLAAIVSPSYGKSFARIYVDGFAPVGFTGDHRITSPLGWYPVDGILQRTLPVYRIGSATGEDRNVRGVRSGVRSPNATLYPMRKPEQGQGAMVRPRHAREDAHEPSSSHGREAHAVRGHHDRYQVDREAGRSSLRVVLGRRSQAHDLSLPVGLDSGEWPDPRGASHSPQERGQDRRSPGELAVLASSAALVRAHEGSQRRDDPSAGSRTDRRSVADMRTLRGSIQDQGSCQAESILQASMLLRVDPNDAYLRGLREDLHRWAGAWETPTVLQSGVLPDGSPLYDLTVDEDHSFIVEGIVAHNSGCRCAWQIIDTGDTWECTWIAQSDGAVCDDCAARAAQWSPYVIRK